MTVSGDVPMESLPGASSASSGMTAASSRSSDSMSPRRAKPEEYVDYDDIEFGNASDGSGSNGFGSLALSFDFEEWRKAKVAPFVRNADKVRFGTHARLTLLHSQEHFLWAGRERPRHWARYRALL